MGGEGGCGGGGTVGEWRGECVCVDREEEKGGRGQ